MLTEQEYKEFVNKHPEITATGYGIDQSYRRATLEERESRRNSEREYLINLYPKFVHCVNWLETRPYLDSKRTTYDFKHDVERWLVANGVSDKYIPQGAFIIAALWMNYTIAKLDDDGPNVYLS
jgi:hypothetical protein